MGTRLRPRKYDVLEKCGSKCSLSEAKLGPEKAKIVHGWFEQGLNDVTIGRNAFEMGLDISKSSVGRHRANHLRGLAEITNDKVKKEKISDLDALEQILQQGANQIDSWKVTPSDYFKALDMKYKLTQGSAFQGMLEALAVAEDDYLDADGEESEIDSPVESEEPESPGLSGPVQG